MEKKIYDMIVIGGGPGGYTAALYAARAGMDVAVLEKLSAGGQMALTHQIENYPGFPEGIDGFTLGMQMQEQAERFGAVTEYAEVYSVDLKAEPKVLETSEGEFLAKTVVLATGADPRELGVEGERSLVGRGVAYCAACDGMFYKGKTVVVVGGGDSAVAEALILSRIAEKVIIVHRRDTLRAAKVYHEPLMNMENVEFRWNSVVQEFIVEGENENGNSAANVGGNMKSMAGAGGVSGIRIKNVETGEIDEIQCQGVFVSIGRQPVTKLVEGQLELDESGYVIAGESTETNIPGVYAVGDVRTKVLRQVV
ncbi:MAG: FAD-dependent oxidoreductase, partial [Firmicutes bacterium]|nr:FAD-dependent oxidoreductase [Bacillota bacterium]